MVRVASTELVRIPVAYIQAHVVVDRIGHPCVPGAVVEVSAATVRGNSGVRLELAAQRTGNRPCRIDGVGRIGFVIGRLLGCPGKVG